MNFSQFEAAVAFLANGKAYSVQVHKLVHTDRTHVEFKWLVWIHGAVRMATGSSPEAALADVAAILALPTHTQQVVDPMEVNSEAVNQ